MATYVLLHTCTKLSTPSPAGLPNKSVMTQKFGSAEGTSHRKLRCGFGRVALVRLLRASGGDKPEGIIAFFWVQFIWVVESFIFQPLLDTPKWESLSPAQPWLAFGHPCAGCEHMKRRAHCKENNESNEH